MAKTFEHSAMQMSPWIRLFRLGMAAGGILQLMVSQSMAQAKCDVLKIAEAYIVRNFPSFDATGKKPIVSETANGWEVTYELPPWMLGGAPIITIDKETCGIVRAVRSQ